MLLAAIDHFYLKGLQYSWHIVAPPGQVSASSGHEVRYPTELTEREVYLNPETEIYAKPSSFFYIPPALWTTREIRTYGARKRSISIYR